MRHGHLQERMDGCRECEMDTKTFREVVEKYKILTSKYSSLSEKYVLLSDELCKLKLEKLTK